MGLNKEVINKMMWPWFHWGFGGLWWIMPLFMIVFWGLIIWGIVHFARRAWTRGCKNDSSTAKETALEILKRRFASGEISKEEFEEKKRYLL